jgi:hypothetical protein
LPYVEAEGHYVRIRRILAEERRVLASIDGDQLALARRYVERELGTALDEFGQFREASLDLLGGCRRRHGREARSSKAAP